MDNVKRFFQSVRRNVDEQGISGLLDTGTAVKNYAVRRLNVRRGTNVYERDWDVLVLLDCARVDMVESLAEEFPFLDPVGTHPTPGTNSAEWMDVTFVDEYADEMGRTVHLTANPNSADHLDGDDFDRLEEIWRFGWDEEQGTVPARTVTDRAIAAGREHRPERMIVHYMQPHPPFVTRPDMDAVQVTRPGDERRGMNVRELHEEGGHSLDELWEAHLENLRYVLSDVELLRENLDADRLVVSADHGQALGEEDVIGHPASSTAGVVRQVPWCETTARDTGAYRPETSERADEPAVSVEEKLEHLGYR
ncbi:hypothetical protein [Halosimplex sp. TS25]|uniref:hypothetical protein n=1 Tax=Halosimplex rarum TaxID=3396619 RepID=UPI0039ED3766